MTALDDIAASPTIGLSTPSIRDPGRRRRTIGALLLLASLLAGCGVFKTKREVEAARKIGVISGDVVSATGTEDVLVMLFAEGEEGVEVAGIAELSELQESWGFLGHPDRRYFIAAFKDLDGDRIWQDGEPVAFTGVGTAVVFRAGAIYSGLVLELGDEAEIPEGFILDATQEAVVQSSIKFSVGEIVTLDDERFSYDTAEKGLWQPLTSVASSGVGLYFLEEYSPDEIPVLFVHGIGGTPLDLRALIEGLDRERFQPWIFSYPSGFRLRTIARALVRATTDLREDLGVETIYVVAHSMGGLVSRSFIHQLQSHPEHADMVGLLVTFASPLGGHSAAKLGLRFTPEPVPAWIDMAPGSAFIEAISKPLPKSVPYYLMFGYRRGGNFLMAASHDSVVQVESQLPLWAQEEAVMMRGFNADHMEILTQREPVETFLRILDEVSAAEEH